MKALIPIFALLLTSSNAMPEHEHETKCSVYGITDAPQRLNCSPKAGSDHHINLNIRCENGQYKFIKSDDGKIVARDDVRATYHIEVTKGSNPLGFLFHEEETLEIVPAPDNFVGHLLGRYQGMLFNPADETGTSLKMMKCQTR